MYILSILYLYLYIFYCKMHSKNYVAQLFATMLNNVLSLQDKNREYIPCPFCAHRMINMGWREGGNGGTVPSLC